MILEEIFVDICVYSMKTRENTHGQKHTMDGQKYKSLPQLGTNFCIKFGIEIPTVEKPFFSHVVVY
mgnify:CR=1 FL=1